LKEIQRSCDSGPEVSDVRDTTPGDESQSDLPVPYSVFPLLIEIESNPAVNLAYQQNGVPIIHSIHITNAGAIARSDIRVSIRSDPPFILDWETRLSRIDPADIFNLHTIDLRLSSSYLALQTERVRGAIIVEAWDNSGCIGKADTLINILAYDEWSGLSSLPEILTAFVTPNHRVIENLLHDAGILLQARTGDSSITGYQTGNRKRVRDIARAVFSSIQKKGIIYAHAPASFEEKGHRIRFADRIMEVRLGNCLDLTCLLAGCLEQAGLHPLIIITEGHAFCGVWLLEESFSDPVTDDLLTLRKRVDLGEICVFDSIALASDTPVSFDDAIRLTSAYLRDDAAFRVVIDVHTTRRGIHRIHPVSLNISQIRDTDGEAGVNEDDWKPVRSSEPVLPRIVEILPVEPKKPVHPGGETPQLGRLASWKKNLLDLSNKNQLLHFHESRQSLVILHPSLIALEKALADGRSFRITPLPERYFNGTYPEKAQDYLAEFLQEEFAAHRLYTHLKSDILSDRLLHIHTAARESINENGTTTLFLALGFLTWYETDEPVSEQRSPIILIPLEIERRSYQEGFTVRQGEEEPRINTTLLHRLFVDFGFQAAGLNPLPAHEHGIDLAGIFMRLKDAIKRIPRWEIQETAIIGHFSYSKFLMWRDLEERGDEILKNPLVAQLNNPEKNIFRDDTRFPDPPRLDKANKPWDLFTPISADSSQLAAVCAAGLGKTFVLYGPPGTGKSQTITNIIAHSLATGKSVLFVSEKKVALDVVHERLKECGIGAFCLELHSNKSNKREVIRQFSQVTGHFEPGTREKWKQQTKRLFSVRNYLNTYVHTLHSPRMTGESFFQGISQLTRMRHIPYIPISWPDIGLLTEEYLVSVRDIVSKIPVAGQQCGHPGSCVWNGTPGGTWSIQWRNAIQLAIDDLLIRANRLVELAENLWEYAGCPPDMSHDTLHLIKEISTLLHSARGVPGPLLRSTDLLNLEAQIRTIIYAGRERDSLRTWFSERFDQRLLNMNINALAENVTDAEQAGALKQWIQMRRIRTEIEPLFRKDYHPDPRELAEDLRTAATYLKNITSVQEINSEATGLFGSIWNEGMPDWDEILQVLDIAVNLHAHAESRSESTAQSAHLLRIWADIISYEELSPVNQVREQMASYDETYTAFHSGIDEVISLLNPDMDIAFGSPANPRYLHLVITRLESWRKQINLLHNWCFWCETRNKAIEMGLGPLVEFYEKNPDPGISLMDVCNRSYYQWWTEQIRDRDDVLRTFIRADFEDEIRHFRTLDDICQMICRDEIRSRLSARIPTGEDDTESAALGILQRQLQLQRRLMPIRTLLSKISPVLFRLKPCMLMSPISVAQYLDPALPKFDLVLFDEASQIPVWDAIGAIARGRSAIIVGDPKQLPPTRIFERIDDDIHTGDGEILESVLDDCIAARIPSMQLNWHYRSRHESLIAFSNYHFYQNHLLTFPSPHKNSAVSLRKVDGIYDQGKSRTNHQEAKAVITEVIRRLRDPVLALQSIGIVTFNAAQQDLIISLLEQARREYPDIDPFFSDERPESVFVKNLENVQGDERDLILFSVGYGPDKKGKISLNFGPLNRDGGERRLNVAITRAREGVIVFSSLRAEHIDLSRTRAEGIRLLKSFLAFAERGQSAVAETSSLHDGKDISYLEEEIADRLREKGYPVHLRAGCGGYLIDLAVVDPAEPGRYLLGIECDGMNYYRAKCARDRDRLREDVLLGLGWKIHRVWSIDWWDDPDKELARIETAIGEAGLDRRKELSQIPHCFNDDEEEEFDTGFFGYGMDNDISDEQEDSARAQVQDLTGHRYIRYTRPILLGTRESFYRDEADDKIRTVLTDIVQTEGPVSREVAMKKVMYHWGIRRLGPAITSRIESFYDKAGIIVRDEGYQVFLWLQDQDPDLYDTFRVPSALDEESRRYHDIPPQEYTNAARHILRSGREMQRQEVIKAVATLFGMRRIGPACEQVIGASVDRYIKDS
jgi:very-short-patch-repair endonuclease